VQHSAREGAYRSQLGSTKPLNHLGIHLHVSHAPVQLLDAIELLGIELGINHAQLLQRLCQHVHDESPRVGVLAKPQWVVEFPACVRVIACVLQCVAACCGVLQRVVVSCSVLQYVAVCCSVLQWVAVNCFPQISH